MKTNPGKIGTERSQAGSRKTLLGVIWVQPYVGRKVRLMYALARRVRSILRRRANLMELKVREAARRSGAAAPVPASPANGPCSGNATSGLSGLPTRTSVSIRVWSFGTWVSVPAVGAVTSINWLNGWVSIEVPGSRAVVVLSAGTPWLPPGTAPRLRGSSWVAAASASSVDWNAGAEAGSGTGEAGLSTSATTWVRPA
jgi:hypothetical protein